MDKSIVEHLHLWFSNYVSGYYSNDSDIDFHIKLKEAHTLRVCSNILSIGQDLGLNESELCLAEITALLHDIGRFEQYKKHRTFSDRKSQNHALLGVGILENEEVLVNMDMKERNILLDAIRFHNIFRIPIDIDSESLLFTKLIRDADKLDILDILVNYYESPEAYPNLSVGEASMNPGYSQQVLSDVLNGKLIDYNNVKTSDDMKLLRLSWIFDINFRYTFECIKNKGYWEKIIKSLPNTEDIRKVQKMILDYTGKKPHSGSIP